jgi:hypothetical protein
MITEPSIIAALYSKITEDARITVWHISLYMSMLSLWQQGGFETQVKISRDRLMKMARFKSITTYHKCISNLRDFGYIKYKPTDDCYAGSIVEITI